MSVNIPRLTAVRDQLLAIPPETFNMIHTINRVDYPCGTVACIAGWACLLDDPLTPASVVLSKAQELLGLTTEQANELFTPETVESWSAITPQQAADTIDRLIATGEVTWEI